MNVTVTEKYLYVIHGDVPEILMARAAYRRVGGREFRGLRSFRVINCPYCNNPLTEVGKDTKVELYRYPARKQIRCQAYPACQVCKNEVGMILT